MSKEAIQEIAEAYREVFLWTPDQDTFEAPDFWSSLMREFEAVLKAKDGDWEDFKARMEANQGTKFENVLEAGQLHVRGDCDNFAWSVIDKVLEEGLLPKEQCYMYAVCTPNNPLREVFPGVMDHMIAVFEIDGKRYAADNASRRPFYRLTQGPFYNYVQFARLDDLQWKYE